MRHYLMILVGMVTLLATPFTHASETAPIDTGRVVAQLVSDHDSVAPGAEFYLALYTVIDKDWHTYWKNPGDSGEPVDIHWAESPDISFGDIVWPLPDTIPTGPIINYGFGDQVLFPIPVKLSSNVASGTTLIIDAEVTYLVCKDICIPESTPLSVSLQVGDTLTDSRWNYKINKALEAAPKDIGTNARVSFDRGNLRFDMESAVTDVSSAYFFADTPGQIAHSQPQVLSLAENGLRLDVPAGFDLETGLSGPISGVLRTKNKAGEIKGVRLTADPNTKVNLGKIKTSKSVAGAGGLTLWTALIGAFLGGLILNLMPCVFPVISMKALGFAKDAHKDPGYIRKQGWLYTFGVLATFLVLTLALLAFKAAGAKIGWGFQLQNPVMIGGLALLFFAIGLNLLGVFGVRMGWENTGDELTRKSGASGAFFTGVLAVVVATPCTAPFMAGAIGFALVQPAIVTVAVFMALGIGFALPFLLLSYWPSLLRKLPKPGPWMRTFQQVLAFFMFGAAIWLIWVLSYQTSEFGTAKALLAMLALGFAAFMWKGRSNFTKLLTAIAVLTSAALILSLRPGQLNPATLSHQPWSPETVSTLRAEGKGVFVDFTAAWCVSCKVNEQLVLNGSGDMFARYNTVMLVADWTNKDDRIADELARHGRSGVPLYLLYPPGHNVVTPAILPQILTKSVLEKALKQAQGETP